MAEPSPGHGQPAGSKGLEAKVQYLLDRLAIHDCVQRYARGVDRHDEEIIKSSFHADAIDNHGSFVGDVDTFTDWVNQLHEADFAAHTHNITTHNCEIDGDMAHVESYLFFCLHTKDRKWVYVGGGRYIDRMEKRDGEWRVALRRMLMDWRGKIDGSMFAEAQAKKGYPDSCWGRDDLSFLRPLELSAEQKDRLASLKRTPTDSLSEK